MMHWMQFRSIGHAADRVRLVGGLVLVLAWLPAAASQAQTPAQGTAQVSVERANFRADCSLSADVMATLLEGAEVEILESRGDWYRIRHPATGVEGCVHASVIGPVTPLPEAEPEEPELEPEEVEPVPEVTVPVPEEVETEPVDVEPEEVEEELPEAPARDAEAREDELEAEHQRFTGYLDFNVGYATPAEDGLSYASPVIQGNPPRLVPGSRTQAEYEYGRDLAFGVAAGFLRTLSGGGGVGAGASLTQATYGMGLGLLVSRPYPSIPTLIVADGFATLGPDREETVLHLHVVYAPPSGEQWQTRFFFGPSVFRSELPVWGVVRGQFPVNPPRIVIRRVEFSTREETVVGGHVGLDVAYFFSDAFGIGASAVLSGATGEISISTLDPEESLDLDVTLGGLSTMLGVRLRF